MLVSIVITARDEDPELLAATLAGLRATASHIPHEIIVVDDGSRLPVRCPGYEVRLLRNEEPRGVSPSRRAGAGIAAGDVLVWIDAHMSFGEWWLEQMLVQLRPCSLLCSPFWSYDLRECHCWGADFVWSGSRDYWAQKYPGFGLIHRTAPPDRLLVEVPMIIGACYMIERDSYGRLGGFSPHFRIWGIDEQDISARAWMAGFRVCCATASRVGHLTRAAFPYPVQYEHLEFNQAVMLHSVFEPATIRRLAPCYEPLPTMVQDWLAATNLSSWRESIQRTRMISDDAFFRRFAPQLAAQPC
jgi:GT2 family glycosyltransferase